MFIRLKWVSGNVIEWNFLGFLIYTEYFNFFIIREIRKDNYIFIELVKEVERTSFIFNFFS